MLCCPPTSCAIKDKVFVVVHSPVWTPSPFVSSEAAAALWCAAPSRPSRLTTTTELTERTFCGAAAAANKQMLQLTSERAKEGRNVGAAQCSNVLATLPRSLTDHYRLPGGRSLACSLWIPTFQTSFSSASNVRCKETKGSDKTFFKTKQTFYKKNVCCWPGGSNISPQQLHCRNIDNSALKLSIYCLKLSKYCLKL